MTVSGNFGWSAEHPVRTFFVVICFMTIIMKRLFINKEPHAPVQRQAKFEARERFSAPSDCRFVSELCSYCMNGMESSACHRAARQCFHDAPASQYDQHVSHSVESSLVQSCTENQAAGQVSVLECVGLRAVLSCNQTDTCTTLHQRSIIEFGKKIVLAPVPQVRSQRQVQESSQLERIFQTERVAGHDPRDSDFHDSRFLFSTHTWKSQPYSSDRGHKSDEYEELVRVNNRANQLRSPIYRCQPSEIEKDVPGWIGPQFPDLKKKVVWHTVGPSSYCPTNGVAGPQRKPVSVTVKVQPKDADRQQIIQRGLDTLRKRGGVHSFFKPNDINKVSVLRNGNEDDVVIIPFYIKDLCLFKL